MPVGGPPVGACVNSACSKKTVWPTFQRRGAPGAVVFGEPTSAGGSRAGGPGCHTDSRGPSGAIVAAIGLGLIENWIGGFFEIAWQEGAVFVIMIVVLFLRPDGLFKRGGMRVG